MTETTTKKNIWLDCDPGQDDVFAIILALFSEGLNVMGISTSFGNSGLENTTQNTLRILTAIGDKTTPVYKGVPKPFLVNRKDMSNSKTHGKAGLSGTDLLPAATRTIEPVHAVHAMAQAFSSMEDDSVSLCVTGPLTNTAFLFGLYPEITKKIKQLVIMGGAIGLASTTPTSEMNIVSDPEAAETVFQNPSMCGKIVLIPLETTHTAIATKSVLAGFRKEESTFRQMMYELVSHFARGYVEIYGFMDGPPIHDPLTIFYVLHPEEFTTKFVHVTVVLGGKADGRTICDIYHKLVTETPNVHLSVKTNPEMFWQKMLAAIDTAATQSPLG